MPCMNNSARRPPRRREKMGKRVEREKRPGPGPPPANPSRPYRSSSKAELGDNVVQLKRKRIELCRYAAVVTPVAGKSANLTQQRPVHSSPAWDPRAFKDCRAFDCR